jgi:prepilin-type N-terminal cleavage/methylation domain-containing protein
MRKNHFSRGFTMLEFAVVITISGILMVAVIRAYLVFVQEQNYTQNQERIKKIQSAIEAFQSGPHHRYPCPADPSLPMSDPNAGLEQCQVTGPPGGAAQPVNPITPAFAVGQCNAAGYPFVGKSKANAICRVAGARTTLAGGNSDSIVMGGVPFKTIGMQVDLQAQTVGAKVASTNDALDPWGYQYTYAVTENNLTDNNLSAGQWGTIDVQSESGVKLTQPPQGANYVVVGHGDDHNGAYTAAGVVSIPCKAIANGVDNYNCNHGNVFISAVRSLAAGATHYDDVIKYSSTYFSSLWDYVSGTNDLHNLNIGAVGVNTKSTQPTSQLQVLNGDLWVQGATQDAASQQWVPSVNAPRICDQSSNCFKPFLLGGYDSSDPSNPHNPNKGLASAVSDFADPSTNQCPASASTSAVNVAIGVDMTQYGKVICTQDPGYTAYPAMPVIAPPLGHHCPGADDSPATTPQYYVFSFNSTNLTCCQIDGSNCGTY